METLKHPEIDLVYLWVDGSDPRWFERRSRFVKELTGNTEADSRGRYTNNDELKFALRSVERHVPWIGKIFIVTDDQQPDWLDTAHPKINITDIKDILPERAYPCFNSNVIEHYLYKIPRLSERFLYSNDDMFFNADLKTDFFFGTDGYPVVRLKKAPFGRWYNKIRNLIGKKPGEYRHIIFEALSVVREKYGKYYPGVPHHNIDAYTKTDYRIAVEEVFKKEVSASAKNRIRSFNDVQRFAFSLYALAIGHAHLQYVGRKTSLRNQLYKGRFKERMHTYKPKLFCMNDNQKAKDEDRLSAKAFLEDHFPVKSSFEKK